MNSICIDSWLHRKQRQVMAVLVPLLAIVLLPSVAGAQGQAYDSWLKANKLGAYQVKEDWADIAKKAKQEGKLVVYASASVVKKIAKDFQKVYPGIKVTVYKLGSEKTVEKIVREQDADLFNADIVTTGGTEEMIFAMLNKKRIVNYVPTYLRDRIPQRLREPLLVRVLEAQTFFYNKERYPDKPPISNVWELTEKKWRGRVGMKNLASSLTTFEAVAGIIRHADKLAAAYKRHTGKTLKLSKGSHNAGYEFLYRLFQNDVVLFKSSSTLVKSSGIRGQDKPAIGLTVMHYLSRNKKNGYVNAVFLNLDPFSTLVYPTYTVIARQAPHPNAAKLFTAFSMGSPELGMKSDLKAPYRKGKSLELLQGLAAEYRVGIVSPRNDVPPPPGGEIWEKLPKLQATSDVIHKEGARLRDFWIKVSGS